MIHCFGTTMNYRCFFPSPQSCSGNVVVANLVANQVARHISLHVAITNKNSRYLRLRRRPPVRKNIGDFVAGCQCGILEPLVPRAGPAPLDLAYSPSVSALCKLTAVQGPRITWDFGQLSRSEEPVGVQRKVLRIPPLRCRVRLRTHVLKVLRARERSVGARCAVPPWR